jgi:hypothetical protein
MPKPPRRRRRRSPLTEEEILAWADAFHARAGRWPQLADGPITGAHGLTWLAVNAALSEGFHRLPGGSSLAGLMADRRGHRHIRRLAPLSEAQILAWADAHFGREGRWPTSRGGPIEGTDGETWANVAAALQQGRRGLPGNSSLTRLLAAARGVRNRAALPRLSLAQILRWADEHHQRTGVWPKASSGVIAAAPQETWCYVNAALVVGSRGLRGNSSLAKLLAAKRGVANRQNMPPLTPEQILAWADAHYRRTGRWPGVHSGVIHGSRPPQTWRVVEAALYAGCRGLPGKSSLKRFLREHGRRQSATSC